MVRLRMTTKANLRERHLQTYAESTQAALAVQRWYRGWVARREVNLIRRATIRVQAAGRGMLDRKNLRRQNVQVLKIQGLYRGHRARRMVKDSIREQTCDLAATMVQSRLRAVIHRRRLKRTLRCAVRLQAAWRGCYVRRRFREEYDRKAQIIIQSRMFESKKVQWYLERERQVMRGKIAVFREWAHSAGKRRALARQRDTAAVVLQRCFRGYLARRERARLRNERQRGKELAKFVELLRSHMSMVIFEEKERHALAFPIRGGKVNAILTPTAGGHPLIPRAMKLQGAHEIGQDRERGSVSEPRAAAKHSRQMDNAGRSGQTQGSKSSSTGHRSQMRNTRARSSLLRNKAELLDALALADLLNLPVGVGGGQHFPGNRKSRATAKLPPVR